MGSQAAGGVLTGPNMGLIAAVAMTVASALAAHAVGSEEANIVFAAQSTVLVGAMVALSLALTKQAKGRQEWCIVLSFAVFSVLWFAAEQIWNYNGIILKIDQFPSVADYLWLLGYVALFVFAVQIVAPVRHAISKRLVFSACGLAASFLVPSIIATGGSAVMSLDILTAILYPVSDAVILVPIICAMTVFKRSKENNMLPLFAAIIIIVITDTVFLFLEAEGAYYAGHPLWLGYEISYILFVYGLYRQNQIMKKAAVPVIEILRQSADSERFRTSLSIQIVASVAVIVFVLSAVQIFGFGGLSVNEIVLLQPFFYAGVSIILALSVTLLIMGKKYLAVKSELDRTQGKSGHPEYETGKGAQSETIGLRLESIGRWSRLALIAILATSLAVGAGVALYIYSSLEPAATLSSGRYTIEGLDGRITNTWAIWYLTENEPLYVSIVGSGLLPADKIDSIKGAILSKVAVRAAGGQGAQFEGWAGALEEAGMQKTAALIPRTFVVKETDGGAGDIIIILSTQKRADDILGVTRSIADADSHQLLKSVITIYDVRNLDSMELAAVTRHEMGHALGLVYAEGDAGFYMHEFDSVLISECTVRSIVSLYDEQGGRASCP